MRFNFPKTKFATQNTMREQLAHCISEGYEAIAEVEMNVDLTFESVVEILDGLHSYETAVRMLVDGLGEDYVEIAKKEVIKKNDERGYYNHGQAK